MYCECTGIIVIASFLSPFICYFLYIKFIYDIRHSIKTAKVEPIINAKETHLPINSEAIEAHIITAEVVYA
jgi:hypothetical protein